MGRRAGPFDAEIRQAFSTDASEPLAPGAGVIPAEAVEKIALWVDAIKTVEVMPRILEVAQIEQLGTDPSSIEWMLQTFREFQRLFVAAGQAGELVMVVKY